MNLRRRRVGDMRKDDPSTVDYKGPSCPEVLSIWHTVAKPRRAPFLFLALMLVSLGYGATAKWTAPIDIVPKPLPAPLTYDITYVRAPRKPDKVSHFPEAAAPWQGEPGTDLMLLHPDGSQELLVAGGPGAIIDPSVTNDGRQILYSRIYDFAHTNTSGLPKGGADIFRLDLATRQSTKLTDQRFDAPIIPPYGVFNSGAAELPDGRVVYTSNRQAYKSPAFESTLQLFVMNADGSDPEPISPMTVGCALHPFVTRNGMIVFSSQESQGLRNSLLWGLWSIRPDGSGFGPVFSAYESSGAPNVWHFMTQLSNGNIVGIQYYHQNNQGFGCAVMAPPAPAGVPAFGPGFLTDARNNAGIAGRANDGTPRTLRIRFKPAGAQTLTRFAKVDDTLADLSDLSDPNSIRVGKVTHPSAAPNNDALIVWTDGPANNRDQNKVFMQSKLCLIKDGRPISEPGQMFLVKDDPAFNEQQPKAVVPWSRIYGESVNQPVKETPDLIPPLANDGSIHPALPEGTPFGLVGTSSLFKRESFPNGFVFPGEVTARLNGTDKTGYDGLDKFNDSFNDAYNWTKQGAESGPYVNADIHAIRILQLESRTDRGNRKWDNFGDEPLRILGEIPVRKFQSDGSQPTDPDGNPDTSFLARIPANVPFTFQTLDKRGMVLNSSQTWHQVIPGELRADCGGCHAHSQNPTLFEKTKASASDYTVFDLIAKTPLVTSKANDQSGKRWDLNNSTGLRYAEGVVEVEFNRDILPVLNRSCVPCHNAGNAEAHGKLDLDADPYFRLCQDSKGQFGYKPVFGYWGNRNASRYIRKFDSRRSLLIWKIYGERLDGWTNASHPTETIPGDASTYPAGIAKNLADIDYLGTPMPPPGSNVPPLSDEERMMFSRWIELGCARDRGDFFQDEIRPSVSLKVFANRILLGAFDSKGIANISVTLGGVEAFQNFQALPGNRWQYQGPVGSKVVATIKDQQGNQSRLSRKP